MKSPIRAVYCKGLTLVEILIGIGVLALFLSFALPSGSSAAARAEVQATTETVKQAIDAARQVARLTESPVAVNLVTAGPDQARMIRFTRVGQAGDAPDSLQDYRIPEAIRLSSDSDSFVFDHRGLVRVPGNIQLASRDFEDISSTVAVN